MTDDHLFTQGSLKVARARARTDGLKCSHPVIVAGEQTVVIGDTAGWFGSSFHWDEQVIAAQGANGLHLTLCLPTHVPSDRVDHVILAGDALANQSTPEELEAWLRELSRQTGRISLVSLLPCGPALARDEEEYTDLHLDQALVSVRIRRDFFRQLQWEWVHARCANTTLNWARCRRWYYHDELEALLERIGQPSYMWVERSSTDSLARGVIELKTVG
jgi:hypothetical protein